VNLAMLNKFTSKAVLPGGVFKCVVLGLYLLYVYFYHAKMGRIFSYLIETDLRL